MHPEISHATVDDGIARLTWTADLTERGWQAAVDVVRRQVAEALTDHERVEVKVAVDDAEAQRIATWSGLRREGVQRGRTGDVVVYARLVDDVPVHEPGGFRALLNSFLPRKRGIAQMLVREDVAPGEEPRVLMCELTYKADWDLPGGVVEVGVLGHDEGVLAARLDDDRGERLGAGGHHPLAGRGGAGEGDLVEAGGRQRRARLAVAGDDLEHRTADRLAEGLGQPLTDARGVLRGLEDDRVAGREGVGDRAHGGEDGVVPRADDTHDAERAVLHARGLVDHQQARGDAAPLEHLLRVTGGPGEVVDRQRDLHQRVAVRLAGLARHQRGELVHAARDHLAPLHQGLLAALEAQGAPALGLLAGGRDGGPDVRRVVDRVGADDLARGGVERLEGRRGAVGGGGRSIGAGHLSNLLRNARLAKRCHEEDDQRDEGRVLA